MRYITLLLVMLILVGCSSKEVAETKEQNAILIQNEKLIGESLYSFELLNTGDIDKECWATLEVSAKGNIINRITKYGGVVKSGEYVTLEIKIDNLPDGLTHLNVIPNCE